MSKTQSGQMAKKKKRVGLEDTGMDAFSDRDLGFWTVLPTSWAHLNGNRAELPLQTYLSWVSAWERMNMTLPSLDMAEDTQLPHGPHVHCARQETSDNQPWFWLTPAPGKLPISYLSQNAKTLKTNTWVPESASFGGFMHE